MLKSALPATGCVPPSCKPTEGVIHSVGQVNQAFECKHCPRRQQTVRSAEATVRSLGKRLTQVACAAAKLGVGHCRPAQRERRLQARHQLPGHLQQARLPAVPGDRCLRLSVGACRAALSSPLMWLKWQVRQACTFDGQTAPGGRCDLHSHVCCMTGSPLLWRRSARHLAEGSVQGQLVCTGQHERSLVI